MKTYAEECRERMAKLKEEFSQEQIKFWLTAFRFAIEESIINNKICETRYTPGAECGLTVVLFPGQNTEEVVVYAKCFDENLPKAVVRKSDNTTDKMLVSRIYEACEEALIQKLQKYKNLLYDFIKMCYQK